MIDLANQGDEDRQDTGCGVLYGVLRDSAYKLKQLAEKEKQAHIDKGLWKENEQPAVDVQSEPQSPGRTHRRHAGTKQWKEE